MKIQTEHLDSRISFLIGLLVTAIGLSSTLAQSLPAYLLSANHRALFSEFPPLIALALVVAGICLSLLASSHHLQTKIAAAIGLVLIGLQLLGIAEVVPLHSPSRSFLSSELNNSTNFHTRSVIDFDSLAAVPTEILCLLCCFVSLLILCRRTLSQQRMFSGLMFALISFVISTLGIYAYLFLFSPIFGWLTLLRLPPLLSLSMNALSIGIVITAWSRYGKARAHIRELLRAVQTVAAMGITVLAITCSAIGIITWYHSNQQTFQTRLAHLLKAKVALIEEYFGRITDSGNQVSGRPFIRSLLDGYFQARVSKEEYLDKTHSALEAALQISPTIIGITRVDRNLRTQVSVGVPVPRRFVLNPIIRSSGHAITFPFRIANDKTFIVKSPILSESGSVLGADFFLVSISQLYRLLIDPELIGPSGQLFIGARHNQHISTLALSTNRGSLWRKYRLRSIPNRNRQAMRRALQGQSGILSLTRPPLSAAGSRIYFYQPISAAHWGLVLAWDTSAFSSRLRSRFITIAAAAVLLSIAGILFFVLLLRSMFRHIFEIENQRHQAAAELNEELVLRKEAERKSRRKGLELQTILDNSIHGIATIDCQGKIYTLSRSACELFGYAENEVIGKSVSFLIPSIEAVRAGASGSLYFCDATPRSDVGSYELTGRRKDGLRFPLEFATKLMQIDDETFCAIGMYDLRERKLSRQKLEESLKEKEVLLKEIHHRVKNNLQVISSIFSLQQRRNNDPKLLELLEQSQSRIQSIALLHESLYRSQNLAQIDMSDYFSKLVTYHLGSHSANQGIESSIQAPGVFLELDKAIPCGLIVSELLMNAIKHAFPDQRSPLEKRIEIVLEQTEEIGFHLQVRDNGIGISHQALAADNRLNSSLGLRLVTSLCTQLKGSMNVTSKAGTIFDMSFK